MTQDLAFRRASEALAKSRARRRLRIIIGDHNPAPRIVGMSAATPKSCSCWMCGNSRRISGPKRCERLADRDAFAAFAEQYINDLE